MLRTLVIGLISWSCAALACAEAERYPREQLLIEPAELAQRRQSMVVLDARSREAYEAGHVPGARWVDHGTWSKAFGDGGNVAAWEQRIGKLGIDNDSAVVVYDDQMAKNAARIWWILRYYGVQDAQLLNGGWVGWKAAELPTEKKPASPQPASFQAKEQPDRLASTEEVLASLKRGDLQILDVRSFGEHCGTNKLSNARGGAIPGAKHLEWSELIDPETHRFKSPAEIKKLFAEAGIELDQPTATHCQSGGRASVSAFGLELMGAEGVQNYYRGWSSWGNDAKTPIEQKPQAEPQQQ